MQRAQHHVKADKMTTDRAHARVAANWQAGRLPAPQAGSLCYGFENFDSIADRSLTLAPRVV